MTRRKESVEELIRQELAKIILRFSPAKHMVTVTDVRVSNDFKKAKVWVSVYSKSAQDQVINQLEKSKYKIQDLLNEKVVMKYVPKVKFELDRTGEEAQRLDEIMAKEKKDS